MDSQTTCTFTCLRPLWPIGVIYWSHPTSLPNRSQCSTVFNQTRLELPTDRLVPTKISPPFTRGIKRPQNVQSNNDTCFTKNLEMNELNLHSSRQCLCWEQEIFVIFGIKKLYTEIQTTQ